MAHSDSSGKEICMFGGGAFVELKEKVKAKGYSNADLCAHWGVEIRQLYRIFSNPKQWHIDSVNWLPRKKNGAA